MTLDLLAVITKALADKESNVVSANRPESKIANLACLVTMHRNIMDRGLSLSIKKINEYKTFEKNIAAMEI